MEPQKITTFETPFNCPNLSGEHISDKFELIEEFFVDKSGMGDGRALSAKQLVDRIKDLQEEDSRELFWAITDEGQFQLYVGIFTLNTN